MTNLLKLRTWADDEHVFAVIETPRGSTCKLDFDADLRVFSLAKPLMAGLSYPYDWGFIPSLLKTIWFLSRRADRHHETPAASLLVLEGAYHAQTNDNFSNALGLSEDRSRRTLLGNHAS
jgi:hypothetical protein